MHNDLDYVRRELMTPSRYKLVPLSECVKGRVYRLRCRNLVLGVFDGKDGFIGIREKFGERFLATEYHWEQGPPYGTVAGAEDTGIDLPLGIEPIEHFGAIESGTQRSVTWDTTLPNLFAPGCCGWYSRRSKNDPDKKR